MPKSKNYLTYPDPFHDLIRTAVTKKVSIKCNGANQARTLRGYLYGFFGALKAASKEKDTPEDIRELYHMTTKVSLAVDEDTLSAYPRDQSEIAQLVGNALKDQVTDLPLPSTTAFTPSAELLEAARKAQEENPDE